MDRIGSRLLALSAVFLAMPAAAAEFFVAPSGTDSGTGTKESPWSLTKAFSPDAPVEPGDTIWLRGGTYTGSLSSHLNGLPNKPIVVRQYPGERVTIDGKGINGPPILKILGSYTWYWGFEIMDSDTTRSAPDVNSLSRPEGVNLFSRGTKLINIIVHDTGQGVLTTDAAPDAEINGSLFYYNGQDAPDRGHGHGIYVNNDTGNKRIVDNILFDQFGFGIHAYTQGGKLDNLHFEGNTSFNNGLLSQVSGATTNFLIGASGTAAETPDSSEKV